ncbi:MAG: helix-turn-helix domain-containing protein [Deltaproteobacteria bacterium]|nr:helix-turn-helix domain-containing protein [Deltaproteobacteria bacterium]
MTKISQRRLAQKSGSSFRTIQLMESGKHNPRLSTLKKLSAAMGYPEKLIERRMDYIWKFPPESAQMIAEFIEEEGESTWKLHLMNFVDRFRMAEEKVNYISEMPTAKISARLSALIASSVETLCEESGIETPSWTLAFPPLKEPWFVAEVESLKALAVIESPVQFRKRNLFVLGNFLDRA